ncbi:MAG: ATP-binding protein [Clostridiales bacterium]|jgi:hypothetical protein|nr:ATP-binding protein [Clostridiales bacterium]
MAHCLNDNAVKSDFSENVYNLYHVDKSMMIEKMTERMIPGTVVFGKKYVCITRPRRFGKTLMLSMLGTYFTKEGDSSELFKGLKISKSPMFHDHINKYNVIHLDLSPLADFSGSCDELIKKTAGIIVADLIEAWPNLKVLDVECSNLADEKEKAAATAKRMAERAVGALEDVYSIYNEKFIFLIDEWDSPFQKQWMSGEKKLPYLDFLKDLFKGSAYIELAYITGVLPIPSYSNTSALNMFQEYRLGDDNLYSQFFGFSKEEVKDLHSRYSAQLDGAKKSVSLRALKLWYDGYKTAIGNIYNPLSVLSSLMNNMISSYWTDSGRTTQVMDYVSLNFDNVEEDVKTLALEQTSVGLKKLVFNVEGVSTRDEILSMLVAVGLLTYSKKSVSIPNREVAEEYVKALEDTRFKHINKLIAKSKELLEATLQMNSDKVAEIIEDAHAGESPFLAYNNESELMHVASSAYIMAREKYNIQRESHAGIGYCDLSFTPYAKSSTAFIVELKARDTAEVALKQIKDKMYQRKFLSDPTFTGRILLVSIGYDAKNKTYKCVIEEVFR